MKSNETTTRSWPRRYAKVHGKYMVKSPDNGRTTGMVEYAWGRYVQVSWNDPKGEKRRRWIVYVEDTHTGEWARATGETGAEAEDRARRQLGIEEPDDAPISA